MSCKTPSPTLDPDDFLMQWSEVASVSNVSRLITKMRDVLMLLRRASGIAIALGLSYSRGNHMPNKEQRKTKKY